MGLAAGINFSMRSVLVTGTHYMARNIQRHVRPDELLQMFGRAGRRGLDEAGYALVTPEVPRLHEAFPLKLKRAEPIDWPSFLAVMNVAASRGQDPFLSALELSRRLFSARTPTLGVEHYYDGGERPCGLRVDGERGRFVRRHQEKMQNSHGRWQNQPTIAATTLGNSSCGPNEIDGARPWAFLRHWMTSGLAISARFRRNAVILCTAGK